MQRLYAITGIRSVKSWANAERMKFKWIMLCLTLLAGNFLLAGDRYDLWLDFDIEREAYEEEAGPSFALLAGPEDNLYGMHFGYGIWLKHTPIFGDYAISIFRNGKEDALYSGIGLTIRIMPHWKLVPFVGAGGAYNYPLYKSLPETTIPSDEYPADRGDSYWGGHIETGVRLWLTNRIGLMEAAMRYVWTSFHEKDRDYWLFFISTGTGF